MGVRLRFYIILIFNSKIKQIGKIVKITFSTRSKTIPTQYSYRNEIGIKKSYLVADQSQIYA